MINSLSKDSHITQYSRLPKSAIPSERSAYNKLSSSATVNSPSIIAKKPAETSFSGFLNSNKPAFNIYTSKTVKKFLKMADEKQPVFNATFSILLTCILRPASIMALPSDKKNKDDKKYAAAHSIAAGVIAYIFSQVIFSPISDAMKKVKDAPNDFIKRPLNSLKTDGKALEAASKYMKMLPEAIFAAPKAIVTIALIPPILKYVFGWEKKSHADKDKNVKTSSVQNPTNLNFKNSSTENKNVFENIMRGVK